MAMARLVYTDPSGEVAVEPLEESLQCDRLIARNLCLLSFRASTQLLYATGAVGHRSPVIPRW